MNSGAGGLLKGMIGQTGHSVRAEALAVRQVAADFWTRLSMPR